MSIPSGNITFLFTDIEGSTKLSQEFPDTLQSALDRHHSIVQNVIEANNGFVFEIIGDAFCCAFQKADDAVKAAVDAQINLMNEKWSNAVIKVRIGIHSGNAEWNGKRYMGYITLARTARVMSVAYGEQVIISNDTYEHVKNLLIVPNKMSEHENARSVISFRDLGERRLKDVIQPIRLFQIEAEGLRKDFLPLKTLDLRPNNLPVQLTSFIGREEEIKQIKQLLRQTHLLTMIGSGGSGKTRLAMQIAADMIDEFANGVFITELAPVSDPALIVQTVINSIGVKEEPGNSPLETLSGYLKDKEILLILDNCEHLINECAKFAEDILHNCQKIKIIATSRESLNCSGEQRYKIPPLSVPGRSDDHSRENLLKSESFLLFIERALSVNQDFQLTERNTPALAEICRRLDGIPLALELAAARIKFMSVENIQERLDDRFNLLTGGKRTALPKNKTLKAMIDWSYDLLSEKEKLLWKRLSVFKGGWNLESAEEICSDDKISEAEILDLQGQLAEKSIIIFDEKKYRYTILETLKKYGENKLYEDNETERMFLKHLNYYMNFSEVAERNLSGSEILLWLEKLEADHLNLLSAVEWSIKSGERDKGARLAVSLWRFWDIRGYYSTGIVLLYKILENINGISKSVLEKTYLRAAQLARFHGDYTRAEEYYEHSLAISNELNDQLSIASSLNGLGNIALDQRDYESAKKYYEKSLTLRRETGDKQSIAKSLNNLGNLEFICKNYELGLEYYEESLKLKREVGEKRGIANSLHNLGNLAFDKGDFEKGWKFSEESLALRKELGDRIGIAESLYNLGNVSEYQDDLKNAKKYFEESLTIYRELGDVDDIAKALNRLGNLEINNANYEQARKYFEESRTLASQVGVKDILADALFELGNISYFLKNYDESRKLFTECIKLRLELDDKKEIIKVMIHLAGMLNFEVHSSNAVMLLGASESALQNIGIDLETEEVKLREQLALKLHGKLSDKEFEKYFEEGKKMTLEEAVQLIVNS